MARPTPAPAPDHGFVSIGPAAGGPDFTKALRLGGRVLSGRSLRVITFVNGYLCTCSCDVAKAEHGVNPHPKKDADKDPTTAHMKNGVYDPSATDNPAVVFGGTLTSTTGANAAGIASSTQATLQSLAQAAAQLVDIQA